MTILSRVGSADLLCLSKAPCYIIFFFGACYFTRLSGKLSVVCYFLYFLPFTKAFWCAQSKARGRKQTRPTGSIPHSECSTLLHALLLPRTISHSNLHSQPARSDAASRHIFHSSGQTSLFVIVKTRDCISSRNYISWKFSIYTKCEDYTF